MLKSLQSFWRTAESKAEYRLGCNGSRRLQLLHPIMFRDLRATSFGLSAGLKDAFEGAEAFRDSEASVKLTAGMSIYLCKYRSRFKYHQRSQDASAVSKLTGVTALVSPGVIGRTGAVGVVGPSGVAGVAGVLAGVVVSVGPI